MKKLITTITSIFLFTFILGCISTPSNLNQSVQPKEIKIRIEGVENVKVSGENNIQRTMEVPNPDPAFSGSIMIVGDVAYYTIWSYISSGDSLNFWKDMKILKSKGIGNIHIYINSGGGNAGDGLALADLVQRAIKEGMNITTEASSIVASAAVPIFLSGTYRIASRGTRFMIHGGTLFKYIAQEGLKDLKAQTQMMELSAKTYLDILEHRSSLSRDKLSSMIEQTTWFSAQQAKEWGMVDEIK